MADRFISADGHVMEPPDLWTKRMDRRFRDRAPYVKAGPEADYLYIEGLPPFSGTDLIGGMANEKAAGKPIENREHNRYADMRAGALDPVARLSDQDLDNARAEVAYPMPECSSMRHPTRISARMPTRLPSLVALRLPSAFCVTPGCAPRRTGRSGGVFR